jgi:hypothetical protein
MARNILEILKALVAHERSARAIGEVKEAEAFAAKIAEMLTAHKLEMSDIDFQERQYTQPLGLTQFDMRLVRGLKNPDQVFVWRLTIADAIALVNGCKMLGDEDADWSIFFAGREEDREAACVLFEFFLEIIERLGNKTVTGSGRTKRAKELKAKVGLPKDSPLQVLNRFPGWKQIWKEYLHEYRESFLMGLANTLETRLKTQYYSMTENNTGVGIIHIKRDAIEVQNFVDEIKTETGHAKQVSKVKAAYDEGAKVGARIPLGMLDKLPKGHRA